MDKTFLVGEQVIVLPINYVAVNCFNEVLFFDRFLCRVKKLGLCQLLVMFSFRTKTERNTRLVLRHFDQTTMYIKYERITT